MYRLRYFLFLACLLFAHSSFAQLFTGMVVDAGTAKPLEGVTIVNAARSASAITDAKGHFSITAKVGDKVDFSYVGFKKLQQTTPLLFDKADVFIELYPDNYQLPEFTVSGRTQYQQDSIEMTMLYRKELNAPVTKTKVVENPHSLGVDGLIGAPVQKMSKSYKKNKRFKKEFEETLEEKYIDTRYTQQLTSSLTGLKGDTLVAFMNAYPMDYQFARNAGDLELQEWIRGNYKEYMDKKKR